MLHGQTGQGAVDSPERGDAQRHVDPEHPAPGQVLGQPAAQYRPRHAGQGIHAAEIALITASFARGHEVADDRLAHRYHAACADALQHSGQHQLRHVLSQRTADRGDSEHADSGQDHATPPIEIAQLAVDRDGHCHGHHIAGNDPGQQTDIIELRGDRRQ